MLLTARESISATSQETLDTLLVSSPLALALLYKCQALMETEQDARFVCILLTSSLHADAFGTFPLDITVPLGKRVRVIFANGELTYDSRLASSPVYWFSSAQY